MEWLMQQYLVAGGVDASCTREYAVHASYTQGIDYACLDVAQLTAISRASASAGLADTPSTVQASGVSEATIWGGSERRQKISFYLFSW
jgi:hypothetical protein